MKRGVKARDSYSLVLDKVRQAKSIAATHPEPKHTESSQHPGYLFLLNLL